MNAFAFRWILMLACAGLLYVPDADAAPRKQKPKYGQKEDQGPENESRRIAFVPELDSEECRSTDSKSTTALCSSMTFPITVFLVPNRLGVIQGCAAALPYNTIKVHTIEKSVELNYSLNDPKTRFAGVGVQVTKAASGQTVDKLIDTGSSGVISPMKAKVTIKAKPLSGVEFPHHPTVEWEKPSGHWVACTGIDPGMVVSAD